MRRIAAALALLAAAAPALAQDEDEACLSCHANPAEIVRTRRDPARPMEPLLVYRDDWKRSVHVKRTCAGCHSGYEGHPHPKDAETAKCVDCHDAEAEALAKSVHGREPSGARGRPTRRADCAACHGVHDVLRAKELDSRLHPLRIHVTCGKCHFKVDPARATVAEILQERYSDDTHAHGILKAGLVGAATCVSCHGGHDVHSQGDPDSRVARAKVDETCGKCHVGVLRDYRESVHFLRSSGAEHKGATCTDCHRPHDIEKADPDFRARSVVSCSRCHLARFGTFRQSYHGKVSSLGFGQRVASCEACHGNHRILPASNPVSPIHPRNLVATCGQCHPEAHEEFTRYLVHVDVRDPKRNPEVHFVYVAMNTLLIFALSIGGLHALLWLVRATAAGEWKRPPVPKEMPWVRRWPKSYVAYHLTLMTCVLVLASTGFPLHYSDKKWAWGVMHFLGGPTAAGWVHRTAAVTLMGLVAVYLAHLAWRVAVRREKGLFAGGATMFPRFKDLQDLGGNLRWFLFAGPRPRYDRWTYWEKFDFWAVFWGMFVIGTSGLMLWFPEAATRWVPGWFLNAAVIVHGIEALLDIAFIFTVHVFHANLRPDKFPMDTVFLTGRITEREFHHERSLEYERAAQEGRLEELLAPAPARRTRLAAFVIGACALAVGFFFVGAMIVAVFENGV